MGNVEDSAKLWMLLGEMKSGIDSMNAQVSGLRNEHKESTTTLHARITEIATSGCARGNEQDRRLERMERDLRAAKPSKGRQAIFATAAGGGIGGILIGVIEAFRVWKSSP
jgi:hypothetical protein